MRFFLIFLFFSLLISACQSFDTSYPEPVKPEAIPTIDPANKRLATAQDNYNKWCAHCHGWAGDGQPQTTIQTTEANGFHPVPRHDSQGHTWQHPDQILFETIKYGVQAPTNLYPMSPYDEQLTDDEIFAIIEYIRQWWRDDQRQHQASLTRQFEQNNPYWQDENLSEEES